MRDFFTDSMFLAEQQLGSLAMRFRGCGDAAERKEIVKKYEEAVENLIQSGSWDRVPPPEDQLPDDLMPKQFFEYWNERASDFSV